MKEIKWTDCRKPRGIVPALWVLNDGWVEFTGSSIPGVLAVKSSQFIKAGKWSENKYQIAVRDDLLVVSMDDCPWDGWQPVNSWSDASDVITVLNGENADKNEIVKQLLILVCERSPEGVRTNSKAAVARIQANEEILNGL